jgi:hypothetical protein
MHFYLRTGLQGGRIYAFISEDGAAGGQNLCIFMHFYLRTGLQGGRIDAFLPEDGAEWCQNACILGKDACS